MLSVIEEGWGMRLVGYIASTSLKLLPRFEQLWRNLGTGTLIFTEFSLLSNVLQHKLWM